MLSEPNVRVQTEVIPLDNYCFVGYQCSLLGSLCMAKSTDSKVGFPTFMTPLAEILGPGTPPLGGGRIIATVCGFRKRCFSVQSREI